MDNQFNKPAPLPLSDAYQDTSDVPPTDQPFKTPDETAVRDDGSTATPILGSEVESDQNIIPKNIKKSRFKWRPTKKQKIIGLVILILLLVGGYFSYGYFYKPSPKVATIKRPIIPPKPITVASNLSGLQVNPSVNKLPVTAVMVENSDAARPQSGLGQAGVVFEAVAEGGVTRFMALYQDTSPTSVGPIRSARPYYVEWALGFDAGYAHVGGSPDALADITAWNVKDLNEFYNANSYQRITSRAAPHNVYTGIGTLNQLEASKGYTASKFTSWTRKAAAPVKVPTATTINFSLSSSDYNPVYTYNAKTNSYNRSEGGAVQTDANTNTQISPKVVIGIVVPESQGALDATGAYYSDYNVLGTGSAYIFQDGTLAVGNWTKSSDATQILFTDASGKPIGLDPGQAWITAITATSKVTYSP